MGRDRVSHKLILGLVGLLMLLAGCAEESVLPPVTRVPLPSETGTMAAPVEPTPSPTRQLPTPQPTPVPTSVWRPREIVALVQQALATSLGVSQQDVPWLALERKVDPTKFTCLDQLVGDIPTFGEGEALVFLYQDERIYVVSSQGALWVCRLTEGQGEAPMTLDIAREMAVADLARRLGVDADAITVVSAREVTWPDRSAGCPQPGVGYAQVPTPGFEVVLVVGETRYIYRGPRDNIALCTTEGGQP